MNFDYAHYMLTDGSKDKENPAPGSPSKVAYLKQLKEIFHKNKTRILEFKNKPHAPVEFMPQEYTSVQSSKSIKPHKHITQEVCCWFRFRPVFCWCVHSAASWWDLLLKQQATALAVPT